MRSTTGFALTARGSIDERETKLRPVLFEKKILKNPDFYRLSDGFKRAFSKDVKDEKLRVPIAGYGGHTRGDRS